MHLLGRVVKVPAHLLCPCALGMATVAFTGEN